MARLMQQVEAWQRKRQWFVGGRQIAIVKMPHWRSYSRAVLLANDPCDETTIGVEK